MFTFHYLMYLNTTKSDLNAVFKYILIKVFINTLLHTEMYLHSYLNTIVFKYFPTLYTHFKFMETSIRHKVVQCYKHLRQYNYKRGDTTIIIHDNSFVCNNPVVNEKAESVR